MVSFPKSALNFSLLCVLLYASVEQVRALKCYICHSDDNESCLKELRDCPNDQAYDRCMTKIYKNPEDGLHIRKECALAPCHLREVGNLKFAHFKSDCDSSNQEDCMFCCQGDGCNKDGATGWAMANVPLLCLMLFLLFLLNGLHLH